MVLTAVRSVLHCARRRCARMRLRNFARVEEIFERWAMAYARRATADAIGAGALAPSCHCICVVSPCNRRANPRSTSSATMGLSKAVCGGMWSPNVESYYKDAERHMSKQWKQLIWPRIKHVNFSSVVEIAAGMPLMPLGLGAQHCICGCPDWGLVERCP
eukprot:4902794-Prymnesium_polylepis.1